MMFPTITKLKMYKEDNHLYYNMDGKKYEDFDSLKSALKNGVSELHRIRFGVMLLMPKDLSIVNLVKLENMLMGLNFRVIKYVAKYSNEDLVSKFDHHGTYKRLHFIKISDSSLKTPLPPEPKDSIVSKTIQVHLGEKEYLFDNKKVKDKELVEYFVKHIDSSTQFNYILNDKVTYQSYITLLASQKQAVQDLRYNDQKVELKFGEHFMPLNRKEYEKDKERLFNKYPLLFTETYIK
jgi:hypothetical protein